MTFDEAGGRFGLTLDQHAWLTAYHPGTVGTCTLMAQAGLTGGNLSTAGSAFTTPGRRNSLGGEFEVAKRHPLKALKVFVMIFFDVLTEIGRERKYRKEFEAQPFKNTKD